jgi:hypothetical protein
MIPGTVHRGLGWICLMDCYCPTYRYRISAMKLLLILPVLLLTLLVGSYKTAAKWYRLAADQGNAYAENKLERLESKITSIYDQHSYGPEKKHALDAWGARLESIIAGQGLSSNVVELQRSIK